MNSNLNICKSVVIKLSVLYCTTSSKSSTETHNVRTEEIQYKKPENCFLFQYTVSRAKPTCKEFIPRFKKV